MQHRRLYRDANIVCLDASRPTGHPQARYARTMPLGLFRESYAALRRAQWAVLTRWDQAKPTDQARLLTLMQRYGLSYGSCAHRLEAARPLLMADHTLR